MFQIQQKRIVGGILWTSVTNNISQEATCILEPYPYEQFSGHTENASVNIGKENFIRSNALVAYISTKIICL